MPRISRGINVGYPYHILNRGNAKQQIFHNHLEYEQFIELMQQAKNRHPIQIIAYCLMPNHFHMVIIPYRKGSLSKFMQWLLTSHVRRHHKYYKSSGHIWQGRYKSFVIQNNYHLLTVLRYVEANPLRAKLVKSAKDWTWSSYQRRIKENKNSLIDESPLQLPRNWSTYVNSPLSIRELDEIHHSIQRQSPYGEKNWKKIIAEKLGICSTIRSKGRPKKIKT